MQSTHRASLELPLPQICKCKWSKWGLRSRKKVEINRIREVLVVKSWWLFDFDFELNIDGIILCLRLALETWHLQRIPLTQFDLSQTSGCYPHFAPLQIEQWIFSNFHEDKVKQCTIGLFCCSLFIFLVHLSNIANKIATLFAPVSVISIFRCSQSSHPLFLPQYSQPWWPTIIFGKSKKIFAIWVHYPDCLLDNYLQFPEPGSCQTTPIARYQLHWVHLLKNHIYTNSPDAKPRRYTVPLIVILFFCWGIHKNANGYWPLVIYHWQLDAVPFCLFQLHI